MTLVGKRGSAGGDGIGAVANSPAQSSYVVGEVGFGPTWQDDEPTLRQMYESACQTIVRLECEADELRAEVALLREQARIMQAQNNELREVMAEIVTWIEDDLRDTVDASYRKAVETAQRLTEGIR